MVAQLQPAPRADVAPTTVVRITVDALVEVGRTMQGIALAPVGAATPFDADENPKLDCGSTISLTRPGWTWNLALFGTTESCKVLARALMCMEPSEEIGNAELADALGEILNMMAGVAKRKLPAEDGKCLLLGLPLFLSGTDCFRYLAKGIKVYCQKVTGPDVHVEVIIVSKEGS